MLHFAHGIASYNNSLVELAKRLHAAGMTLCVASHIDMSDVLREAPCEFQLLTHYANLSATQGTDDRSCKGDFLPIRIIRMIAKKRRYRAESLQGKEVENFLISWQPDLLLIDMECHVAILQTRHANIPTLLCSRWFSVFRSPDLPPMHTPLLPPRNLLEGFRIRLEWAGLAVYKYYLDCRHRLSWRRFQMIGYDSHRRFDLAAVARRYGVELSKITETGHWLIPHVYKDLPVMSLTAKAVEFEQACDPRMCYVGGMVGRKTARSPTSAAALAEFEQFLSARGSDRNPLVYCSFSTFWAMNGASIEPLINLFSNRPDIDLVVGLGGASPPDFLSVPDNVLVLSFAPQLEVIRCASIVITHGGISSINEALRYGVPMIGVSGRKVDQDGCLARVQYHGLGVLSESDLQRPNDIMMLVDFLLSEAAASIRGNVRQVQAQLEAHEIQNSAVGLLKKIAQDQLKQHVNYFTSS